MKLLHSADWHLDSPLLGRTPEQCALLKQSLLALPGAVISAAHSAGCDLILLSGDLFDGTPSAESLKALKDAFAETGLPIFIAPGNHDPISSTSVWMTEVWPANVHIFTSPAIEFVPLPALNCRVYGAAFTDSAADSLLEGFRAEQTEAIALGVLHGDPTQATSPYNPITTRQIADSGLHYLALGHIHKGGQLTAGSTLCAWPGCPQGRGFDELGEKGVLIVTLEDAVTADFVPLNTVRFYDLEVEAGADAAASLSAIVPPAGSQDLYRITFTGESAPIDTDALKRSFSHFPNLELRDRTVPPLDIWGSAGDDTLEGVYFGLLHSALEASNEETARQIQLAARISRQILSKQEVVLP